MATTAREATAVDFPRPKTTEQTLSGAPGLPILGIGLATLLIGGALLTQAVPLVSAGSSAGQGETLLSIILLLVSVAAFGGLIAVAPGEARVIGLFGRYTGTIRTSGLRWVNPLARRKRVSTRLRNHETTVAKVNDATGNPIEISAVVVWCVEDTARATYDVEDFVAFVNIQTETAVRHVATSYPYDGYGEGTPSLRENATEIAEQLSAEIAARVRVAGVAVIESRITRLAYAPEIAAAMLRRQQAAALIAARQRIVEGAVGMVQMALVRLDAENIVELDPERKAAMVSNLLVVLCSDHPTVPVINTGSLYH